ncbi:MAG: response regulator [Pseudomonadota bacterium]
MAGETILIVEDEGILAVHLQYVLTELGYHPVGPAASGEEAISAAVTLKPDLILMDINLTGAMNGIAAAGHIGAASSVPIIFLTGDDEDSLVQEAKEVAPYGYLVKPVSERELAATIEMALHRHTLDFRLKTSRQQLLESEERYRSLFDNNHAVMLLIDPDTGVIRDANSAACAYYGWRREELINMGIDEINTMTPEKIKAEMQLARAEKRNQFFFQHRLANGTIRDVEVYSGPIPLKGKFLLYSIVHDITDRKRAEAEKSNLEAQNRQLQKAESLARMAGAIAHHFNNQLQAVIGYIDIAGHELPRDSISAESLTQALKAANRAAEVSRLMLIYLGQTPAKQEPMNICEVCRWSLPLLRAALPETISLISDFPSPGPGIIGNAGQIQQVLTNLVTNAREAIGDGPGNIHLVVRVVSASEVPMANRFPVNWETESPDYACLVVTDSGQGVLETNIEKIFDPFFTSKFTGRGLGLPVVLGIARAHRGAVVVNSEPGRGSAFRVFFPMPAQEITPPPCPKGGSRVKDGSDKF